MNKNILLKLKKPIIIHPFLFAIFPIIFLFSVNVDSVLPEEIILPLFLVIAVTFLIWIALGFLLKNRIKSGFIVSLGLAIFFSYGHIYIILDEFQPNFSNFFLIIPTLVLFGLGSFYFIRTKNPLNNATTIVNGISVALIIISFVGIGEYFMTDSYSSTEIENKLEKNISVNGDISKFPDVYYIILDGYAGSESLQKIVNYDNSDFLDFLTKKGFYVASESFSNYEKTLLSIPSTLNMNYLNNFIGDDKLSLTARGKILEMARENTVFEKFKSKGYTIYTILAGSGLVKDFNEADFVLCKQKNLLASDFNNMLIRLTMLNLIHAKTYADDARETILCGFTELDKMADRNDKPKFVYSHIVMPHRPFIFGPNGEPIAPKFLTPDDHWGIWDTELFLGQLEFTNKKMKSVIEKLIDTNTPPIIIIQSDHGMRGAAYANNEYDINLKKFNNLKAYYFPEKGRNIEFETTTNVNSFRVLFNLYFDEQYKLLEDKIYIVGYEGWDRNSTDVTDILIKK